MSETPFSPSGAAPGTDGDLAVRYLLETRPWLWFLAVLGFLASGLMMLGGLAMSLVSSMLPDGEGEELAFIGPAVGLVYVVLALVYAVPAWLMVQQAMAIGNVTTGGMEAIGEVLRHHRNFWRFVGGATAVLMVLYCGGIGLFTMVGIAGM
jgi:hypothetical protein